MVSFLSQTPVKMVPNQMKWVAKFVQKWNLTTPSCPYNQVYQSSKVIIIHSHSQHKI